MNNAQKLSFLTAKLSLIEATNTLFVSGVLDELREELSLFANDNISFDDRYSNFKNHIENENYQLWCDYVNDCNRKKANVLYEGIKALNQVIAIEKAMNVI